jgi:hypothetical protein
MAEVESAMLRIRARESNRTGAMLTLDVAMLLLGGIGLFQGLQRLATSPLEAVLIILSAMFFLLFPAAGLSAAVARPAGLRKK